MIFEHKVYFKNCIQYRTVFDIMIKVQLFLFYFNHAGTAKLWWLATMGVKNLVQRCNWLTNCFRKVMLTSSKVLVWTLWSLFYER